MCCVKHTHLLCCCPGSRGSRIPPPCRPHQVSDPTLPACHDQLALHALQWQAVKCFTSETGTYSGEKTEWCQDDTSNKNTDSNGLPHRLGIAMVVFASQLCLSAPCCLTKQHWPTMYTQLHAASQQAGLGQTQTRQTGLLPCACTHVHQNTFECGAHHIRHVIGKGATPAVQWYTARSSKSYDLSKYLSQHRTMPQQLAVQR